MAARMANTLLSLKETKEPIERDDAMRIEGRLLAALDNLTDGNGSIKDMEAMATEFGMAIVMCHKDFVGSGEYMDVATAARDALHAVGQRFIKTGKWGVTGLELKALRAGVELRAALLNHEDNTKGIEARAHERLADEIRRGNVIRFTKVEEAVTA